MATSLAETKILVVDDDDGLRETLADFLEQEGYGVFGAGSVPEARAAAGWAPDLILLDLSIPGGGGLSFLAEIRARSAIPVIIISGKGATIDRVVGLEVGADDYLPKPFELRELLARIRAVLRRSEVEAAGETAVNIAGDDQSRVAHFGGGLLLMPGSRKVINQAGVVIDLTPQEYNLVAALVDRPHRVHGRDAIANMMNKRGAPSDDRNIDALVSRVRRKLSAHADGALIQTVRGEGYVLASDVRWTGKPT